MADVVERLNAALEGRYGVERELGRGGMATVYLAHDVRHERPVAIKVLHPELAAVMGAERFLSEIRTTANLQHPHILPLHDSGDADGFVFYVMPYVEGESLRDRLDREKQLPVEEAVRIARAAAGALDYAHRHGVIHRDIKPANILLHDGQPLLADFGIALAVSAAGGGRLTETGLSLGTPFYMSPEQAAADRDPGRPSDVYSLGCVLYEMLTGEPPHTGGSAQAVLAKILTEDPRPVTAIRRSVPENVTAAVGRALERVPADRFETAEQFARALDDPSFRHETIGGRPAAHRVRPGTAGLSRRPRLLALLPWGLAAAFALLAARGWFRPAVEAAVTRVAVTVPKGQEVVVSQRSVVPQALDVSPDGRALAYVGKHPGAPSESVVWMRPLDRMVGEPLTGTSGAVSVQFSADGERLAFFHAGSERIGVVPASGGPPVFVPGGGFFRWGDDGALYFRVGAALHRAWPGDPRRDTLQIAEARWNLSDVLDGSRKAVVTVLRPGAATVSVADLETGEVTPLVDGRSGRWLPTGHLAFEREGTLMVAPFDPRRGRITGPAVATPAEGVLLRSSTAQYAVGGDGTLAYLQGAAQGVERVVWVDRTGREESIDWLEAGAYEGVSLSPEGRRVAFAVGDLQAADVWVYDLADRTGIRLTREGNSRRPVWTPDGRRISYLQRDTPAVVWTAADGSGGTERVAPLNAAAADVRWWGDSVLLVRDAGESGTRDVFWMRRDRPDERTPFLTGAFNEGNPALSPDGRWLAYVSDETGRDEVYVQPFPEGGRRIPVSTEGGGHPIWSRDGSELFYSGADFATQAVGWMWSARVRTSPDFVVLSRERLFDLAPYALDGYYTGHDLAPDGRFLLVRDDARSEGSGQLVLVRGWFAELRGR